MVQKYLEQKIIRLIMQSKCPVFGIKKSRFIKNQEGKGLLNNLGIKTALCEIPLLNILFRIHLNQCTCLKTVASNV